ncbi:uroporphyrinogen-III synthase [Ovoidimarina sediminis]|uniref:uroporphyrinogen-III synthase n=1 Tax=Ovoidimarina sediminis TaxID=3079856 RepID=UPI0029154516|nr:uroporphyrinogen-III synthase [Rhodophyticola sp. MJ-SS7]MDU8942503.1 uroporphyrinogen-III synthase [Rhodophyticola sp. MJ-SS7]
MGWSVAMWWHGGLPLAHGEIQSAMPGMTGPGTVILLTRPEASSGAFAAGLAGAGAEILTSPLQEIVPLGDPVTLAPDAVVLFTSRHAPPRVADAAGQRAYCVGDATAEAARAAGFTTVSASGTAEDLVRLVARDRPVGPLFYLRGRNVSHDLVQALEGQGRTVAEHVVYDQEERPLDPAIATRAAAAARVIAPLFSPRSADLLARALPADIVPHIVAISARTAAAWTRPAAQCAIAAEPTAAAMLDLTRRVLDSDSRS